MRRIPLFLSLLAAIPTTAAAGHIDFGPKYVGRVLTEGSAVHELAGVAFDPNDRLWAVSLLGQSITIFNAKNGHIIDSLGAADGIITPDDLDIAPDGTVYFSSFFGGQAFRLDTDGTLTSLGLIGLGVDGVTLSSTGRLVVGQFLAGDGLWELDPAGIDPPRLITNLPGMEGLDFGPDGKVYAALLFTGEIARIDPDSGAVEIVASGLTTPISVKFNHAGRLFCVENDTGRILEINPSTGAYSVVAVGEPGLDNLAFNSRDEMYLTSIAYGSIHTLNRGGHLRTVRRGGIVNPGGLAIAQQHGDWRLFEADGTGLRSIGLIFGQEQEFVLQSFGDPSQGISLPLTVSPWNNRLVTTSWVSNLVQIWNPNTHAVEGVYPDFAAPLNAIDMDGDIVVAELGTGTVTRLHVSSGARDVMASGLFVPAGLAAQDGKLWVVDWASGVLWQIADGGAPITPTPLRGGLAAPEGLAIDSQGRLIVHETGAGRVIAIHSTTLAEELVVDDLPPDVPPAPGAPPTWTFSGIAVGPLDTIYIAVGGEPRVLQAHRRLLPPHW